MLIFGLKKALSKRTRRTKRRFQTSPINLQHLEQRLLLSANSVLTDDVSAGQQTDDTRSESSVTTPPPAATADLSGTSGSVASPAAMTTGPEFTRVYFAVEENGTSIAGDIYWEGNESFFTQVMVQAYDNATDEFLGATYTGMTGEQGSFFLYTANASQIRLELISMETGTVSDTYIIGI